MPLEQPEPNSNLMLLEQELYNSVYPTLSQLADKSNLGDRLKNELAQEMGLENSAEVKHSHANKPTMNP